MIKLSVNGKEYKLKFHFNVYCDSGLIREVSEMQKKQQQKAKSAKSNSDMSENVESLQGVFELISKLTLAALQKYHEEFKVDYNKPETVTAMLDKVDEFIDDYLDEPDSMPVIDFFNALTDEFFKIFGGKQPEQGKSEKDEKSLEVDFV